MNASYSFNRMTMKKEKQLTRLKQGAGDGSKNVSKRNNALVHRT